MSVYLFIGPWGAACVTLIFVETVPAVNILPLLPPVIRTYLKVKASFGTSRWSATYCHSWLAWPRLWNLNRNVYINTKHGHVIVTTINCISSVSTPYLRDMIWWRCLTCPGCWHTDSCWPRPLVPWQWPGPCPPSWRGRGPAGTRTQSVRGHPQDLPHPPDCQFEAKIIF